MTENEINNIIKMREDGVNNFVLRFNAKFGDKFEYVGGYVNRDSSFQCRCRKCGDIFSRNASTIRNDNRNINCVCCIAKAKTIALEAKRCENARLIEITRCVERLVIDELKSIIKEQKTISKTCRECGTVFVDNKVTGLFCSDLCKRRWTSRYNDTYRRHKLRANGKVDHSISIAAIMGRNGNYCYICGGACDYDDFVVTDNGYFIAGETYPSIDHVIPVARGGTHTWGNVRLAHRKCNWGKRDLVCYGDVGKQMQLSM